LLRKKSLQSFLIYILFVFIAFQANTLKSISEVEKNDSKVRPDILDIINESSNEIHEQRQNNEKLFNKLKESDANLKLWANWHYKWSYNWNFISTIIIFFIVNIMVLSGLYFSYLQFKQSVLNTKDNKDKNETPVPQSTISLGAGKIEITSSIIGLLILVLSFAFFYLYILYVYPITVDRNTPLIKEQESIQE